MIDCIAKLTDVTKHYARGRERVEVLRNINLEIRRGEFLVLMGPSGSGKTSLLNLLGGLDKPDGGSVFAAGQHLEALTETQLSDWRARHVGFIFQFYHLLPMLSAAANVEVPLLLTNLPRQRRIQNVATALSLVGLADRARHKPSELSGGQQQRVAIARAIAADPNLILCDEPTGDLDRQSADDVLRLLRLLNREHGKSIVMVTHDSRAAAYGTRIIEIDKSSIREPKTAEALAG